MSYRCRFSVQTWLCMTRSMRSTGITFPTGSPRARFSARARCFAAHTTKCLALLSGGAAHPRALFRPRATFFVAHDAVKLTVLSGRFGSVNSSGSIELAVPGQKPKYSLLKCLPVSGHSQHAASAKYCRVEKRWPSGASCGPDAPRRILSARTNIARGQGMSGHAPESEGGQPPTDPP